MQFLDLSEPCEEKLRMPELHYFHPLVLTLLIYVLVDLAFAFALGFSAYHIKGVWSNSYYPALNSAAVIFTVFSVYIVAYSSVKLALVLHGILKLLTFLWTLHCVIYPDFHGIIKPEALSTSLYYLLTLFFEMTACFVINKMNIPLYREEGQPIVYRKGCSDEEDEVMATCC